MVLTAAAIVASVLECMYMSVSECLCRASGKLANLTIRSTAAACITHLQGHLIVDVRSSAHLLQDFFEGSCSAKHLWDLPWPCIWPRLPLGSRYQVPNLSPLGRIIDFID